MKTMITKEVDGQSIVLGFANASFDPMTTRAKVIEQLKQSDEVKTHHETCLLIGEKTKEHMLLLGKKKKTKADEEKLAELKAEVDELQHTLQDDFQAIDDKSKELHIQNTTYFEPKIGEEIIGEEEDGLVEAFSKLEHDQLLKADGTIIPNHKGKKYFVKKSGVWEEEDIASIGVEPSAGAKSADKLTADERHEIIEGKEKQRVKKLTPEDKSKEKESRLQSLLVEAAHRKIQLEVSGEEDSLKKSQDWYNEKKSELEQKYA